VTNVSERVCGSEVVSGDAGDKIMNLAHTAACKSRMPTSKGAGSVSGGAKNSSVSLSTMVHPGGRSEIPPSVLHKKCGLTVVRPPPGYGSKPRGDGNSGEVIEGAGKNNETVAHTETSKSRPASEGVYFSTCREVSNYKTVLSRGTHRAPRMVLNNNKYSMAKKTGGGDPAVPESQIFTGGGYGYDGVKRSKLDLTEQPSTLDVDAAFGSTKKIDKKILPVHQKSHVTVMDMERVACLDNKTPACRKFFLYAGGWCTDPTRYDSITLIPKKPRISKEHFEVMKGYKYKPLYGLPEGFVDAFMRIEQSKNPEHVHGLRLRPLFAPDANEECATREKLQKLQMTTRGEARVQGAKEGEEAKQLIIQFDMLSYYDQFGLSEAVKRKLCFLGPDGIVYALERLPMGLRPACEVAQATTWMLLDFEMGPSVKLTTCIDNIRFIGKKDEVVRAVRVFLDRCRRVGAQLDKWPASDSEADIIAMGERRGDFLGEFYDYDAGTRKLTDRSVNKVKTIKEWLSEQHEPCLVLNARQFSVVMGMLFWTASVLDLPLCRYFHLLRDYRRAAAAAATTASYDEVVVKLTPTAIRELKAWVEAAAENKAVPMTPIQQGAPNLNLVVDASGLGHCTISTTNFTDCQVMSGVWATKEQPNAQSSVWAEPEAIFRGCLRFVRPSDRFVRIYTDHSPVVYAAAAGYAKGFAPNLLIERLKVYFPDTVFEIVHVKGVNNPADRYSRLGGEVGGDEKMLSQDEMDKIAMLAADKWEQRHYDNVSTSAYNKRPSFMV